MNSPSRSHPSSDASRPTRQVASSVQCELCELPMAVPQHCVEQGVILGMLVCPACTEANLDARAFDAGPRVELVGASR